MKPRALKIVEIIFMSILGFIILVLSIFIIQRLVNKDKPANILGFYLYEVDISGSMYNPGHPDSLSPGDLLFVRKEKEYVVGDVVTYQLDGAKNPTTHKIINIDGSTITTQGINPNNSPDVPFDEQFIIGKVQFVWYGFANFKKIILSPYAIVALVIVGIGAAEGFSLIEKAIIKKQKKKEEEANKDKNNEEIIVNQNTEEN